MIASRQEQPRSAAGRTAFTGPVWLLHGSLALLFVGMTLALCVVTFAKASGAWEPLACGCLILMLPLALRITPSGSWTPPLLLLDVLLVLNTLSGLPGMFYSDPGSNITQQVGYAFALAIRNYVLFIAVPRSTVANQQKLEILVQFWLLVAVVMVLLGSLGISIATGITLTSHGRLTGSDDNWLHPNLVGVFAGAGLLLCLSARFIPGRVRIPIAALSLYILLLSQSRSSLVTTLITLAVYAMLQNRKQMLRFCLGAAGLVFLLAIALPPLLPAFSSLGPVANIIERSGQEDPTAGRVELVSSALDKLNSSPVVGFGYNGAGRRIENGLVSLASETGFLGLSLYIAFSILVASLSVEMLLRSGDERAQQIGVLTTCLTVFLFVRSFGERSNGFQLSDIISNAWILLAGFMVAYRHQADLSRVRADAPDRGTSGTASGDTEAGTLQRTRIRGHG